MDQQQGRRPRVVIVGAGFGGLAAAMRLARADVEVTIVDRRNHHLFQPLLYQVATAWLSPGQIAQPVRTIFRRRPNVRVLMDSVEGVDTARRVVRRRGGEVPYDALVLATGATHAYFGHPEWEAVAPGLKSIGDATKIRSLMLAAFENAELAEDEAEREAWLTVCVVGGGPTGVEMAGAIAELSRRTLAREFRSFDPRRARILLAEAGERLLPAMAPDLSEKARIALERLGTTVITGAPVTDCRADSVTIGGEVHPCRTIIWAAGVKASPAGEWLGVPTDRSGRVEVTPTLEAPGLENVFVIGDTAVVRQADGSLVPGIAPAAKQEGRYVAGLILARAAGRSPETPFRYRHQGTLATIGRNHALVDLGWLRLTGFVGWLFWGLVHILFLIDFRNRISVSLDWLWAYLTRRRAVRLITMHTAAPRLGDADHDPG